jgi:hypothetical protein
LAAQRPASGMMLSSTSEPSRRMLKMSAVVSIFASSVPASE